MPGERILSLSVGHVSLQASVPVEKDRPKAVFLVYRQALAASCDVITSLP